MVTIQTINWLLIEINERFQKTWFVVILRKIFLCEKYILGAIKKTWPRSCDTLLAQLHMARNKCPEGSEKNILLFFHYSCELRDRTNRIYQNIYNW